MANLTEPRLSIDVSAEPNPSVTATVNISFSTFETFLLNNGLTFQLDSQLRGNDSGLKGNDDELFSFPSQTITRPGAFVFQATVSRETLNEDRSGNDEIYANFTLRSNENSFPLNQTVSSPEVEGDFD